MKTPIAILQDTIQIFKAEADQLQKKKPRRWESKLTAIQVQVFQMNEAIKVLEAYDSLKFYLKGR